MSTITDVRVTSDFSKLTFSNFKKTDVIKQLVKSFRENKQEESCYWCAELICSGFIVELWESIILYMSKYIHIGNPKLPIYIGQMIEKFKKIVDSDPNVDDLKLRNNNEIRQLFAEIMIVLVESGRKHAFSDNNKITQLDFDLSNIGTKLLAPNMDYVQNTFKNGDIKEVYIAVNELYYNIHEVKDNIKACYWIDWILEFDVLMRKHNKKKLCERRTFAPVAHEEQINLIWIVWDIFLQLSKTTIQKKIVESLLNIFCLKFSKGTPKKRRNILYFVVTFLTENINYNIPIIKNQGVVDKIKNNIDVIYKEIKKGEIAPKNDFLIANLRSNTEKSIEKLKILNNVKF